MSIGNHDCVGLQHLIVEVQLELISRFGGSCPTPVFTRDLYIPLGPVLFMCSTPDHLGVKCDQISQIEMLCEVFHVLLDLESRSNSDL